MMNYQTILHIDDDQDDLEIFSTTVDELKAPINCISINCAATALKKLISREVAPELIFLDLNMPGMDGFEFLAAVQKVPGFKIPIFVLSTSSHRETMDTVKKLGAEGYLVKPSSIRHFVEMLTPFFFPKTPQTA